MIFGMDTLLVAAVDRQKIVAIPAIAAIDQRPRRNPAEILALGPSCVPQRCSPYANSLCGQNSAGSRKSVRAFKGMFCDDISEFESYVASQPVPSLRRKPPLTDLFQRSPSGPLPHATIPSARAGGRSATTGVAKMPHTDTSSVITDQITRALGELLFGYGAICPKGCKIMYSRRR